jgi:hypothetical protein
MTTKRKYDGIWPGIAVSAVFWLAVIGVGALLFWLWLFWL